MAERIKVASEAGLLGDILDTLRFRSTIFFRSQLAAPWGFSLQEEPAPRFHISMRGGFYVGGEERRDPVEVGDMEIVILPRGRSHWIADRPGTPLVPSEQGAEACEMGAPLFQEGAITNQLMCGVTRFDADFSHPLLETLPPLIHLPRFGEHSRIWRLIELIDTEAERSPGLGTPILDRLTEILFLALLLEIVEQWEEPVGFVAALQDPQLRQALDLLHREPAASWTIDDLAAQVALSRATLVRRFRESVGIPPMEYLARWRLSKAHRSVKYTADSIERIAEEVGFSSAQTLTRAFRRHFGVTPSSLRR